MPVTVMLEPLVSISKTRPVWPEEFSKLIQALESEPEDGALWGALGDWCQEHGEHGMARAFRWKMKRPSLLVVNSRPSHDKRDPYWTFSILPNGLATALQQTTDRISIAGLVAELAAALRRLDEELS